MLALLPALRTSWPAVAVILLAAVLQVFLIAQPVDFLVANILPDDAFYYFQIARHIVEGVGSTFDGIHPTNGYHPLWMLVLLPIFKIFSVGGTLDTAPLYATLTLSILLTIGTAFALLLLIRRITDDRGIQALALFVWCLNPFMLYETINGLETALALFLSMLFAHAALAFERSPSTRRAALAGILAGLMILARLDMVCYVGVFGVWMLLRHGARTAFFVAAIVLLTILPWFLWNAAAFQMLGTSAANGNTFINHALVAYDNGSGLLVQIKGSLYLLVYHAKLVLERTGAAWFVFMLLGMALAHVLSLPRSRLSALRVPLILVLFAGGIALFLINTGLRFTGRTWYFVSLYAFLALGTAWTLAHAVPREARNIVVSGLAVLLACSFALSWKESAHGQFRSQTGMLEMARWMNTHLLEDTSVGVFNAGVQGYFSHVRVINLDGLVNNSAYEAITDRRLWSYIEGERISYISDFDLYLTYRYAPFFDTPDVMKELTPVHRIELPDNPRNTPFITLYQVAGP